MKRFLFLSFCAAALSGAAYAQELRLTQANAGDCPSEAVVDGVMTQAQAKSDLQSRNPKFVPIVKGADCESGAISVGINGRNYKLAMRPPATFGGPVLYESKDGVSAKIEQVATIYEDKANPVEVGDSKVCVPSYRKVRVTVDFNGQKKSVLGTALGNCPYSIDIAGDS